MRTLRWGEFAHIAVRDMAAVKTGETLLVLADTWTDMDIAEACLSAGINAGANAQLLVIPRMAPTDTTEFNASVSGAIKGADVILGLCPTMFIEKAATAEARANGTRIASTDVIGMEDFAIEGICDVDYRRMIEVAERIGEIWQKTGLCRVTSALGTDIGFDLRGRPIEIGDGVASEPGTSNFFPGVCVANAPIESTINGVIVVDGNIPPGRLVNAPVTVHLERGVITGIEGGADAGQLRAHFAASGDPVATHLCHFTLGLNPLARNIGEHPPGRTRVGGDNLRVRRSGPGFRRRCARLRGALRLGVDDRKDRSRWPGPV